MVRGVEKSFSAKNEGKNYNYYGAIDLLLSPATKNTDSDAWIIIDYKNTKTPAKKDIMVSNEKLGDFQMPMYISLIKANKACGDVDVARFYAIKDASTSVAIDINTAGCSKDDFEPTMKAFERYSDDFERIVASKNFAPDLSKVDKHEDCSKCNFKAVCRRTYEVAKRN